MHNEENTDGDINIVPLWTIDTIIGHNKSNGANPFLKKVVGMSGVEHDGGIIIYTLKTNLISVGTY